MTAGLKQAAYPASKRGRSSPLYRELRCEGIGGQLSMMRKSTDFTVRIPKGGLQFDRVLNAGVFMLE